MNEILLVYSLAQIDEVERYAQTNNGNLRILAMDFWVEQALANRGISCESFKTYRLSPEEFAYWHKVAQDTAREWYRIPAMQFFMHRKIRLAEAAEPAVESYLQNLLYYALPLKRALLECGPEHTVVVPNNVGSISPTSGLFTLFELNAVADIVRAYARVQKFAVRELGESPKGSVQTFPPQSSFRYVLYAWNFCMQFFPRKKIKLFASENWSHIQPFLPSMPDAELVLMDRKEARHIPWKEMLVHRMRFIHPQDMRSPGLVRMAHQAQSSFALEWQNGGRAAVEELPMWGETEVPLWELVSPAIEFFITEYSERLVFDAEALVKIFKKEKIEKVLLRASVSGRQPHFFLAAKIAPALGIPSIELQHAGAVLDPNSVHSRMEASYLASYGPLTGKIYAKNHGYALERIRPVGSPRFDRYLDVPKMSEEERVIQIEKLGFDPGKPLVLIAAPADVFGLMPHVHDAYAVIRMFEGLKQLAEKMPDIQLLFKFRLGNLTPMHREYIEKNFGSRARVVNDDLFERIRMSDVVISSNSTTMYETMIAKKPLMLFSWRKDDPGIEVYAHVAPLSFEVDQLVETLSRVFTDKQYAQSLVEKQTAFLNEWYAFDGHSSERVVSMLRETLEP